MSYPPIVPARVVTEPSGRKTGFSMLYNGNCPGPSELPFRFVQVDHGQVGAIALDNHGRIFTWGDATQWIASGHVGSSIAGTPNFNPHPAIALFTNSSAQTFAVDMLYPYQVGTKSDWVKVASSEYIHAAIDSAGHVYVWGDGYWGQGGWPRDSKYMLDEATNTWVTNAYTTRDCSQAIVPTLANNEVWKDFSLGWYCVMAQKFDRTMWLWGNNDSDVYGMPEYPDDDIQLAPIPITGLPASPVKLFAMDYGSVIIATENNQVWVWGTGYIDTPVPTQKALSIPAGVNIVKVGCARAGAVVLLSNGNAYGIGNLGTVGEPDYFTEEFVLIPGGHFFVDIDVFSDGAIGRDELGNIWGWGYSTFLISAGGTYDEDAPCSDSVPGDSPVPLLTAVSDRSAINQRQWIAMSAGGWCHGAIDNQGRLFSWGRNTLGEMGNNDAYWMSVSSPFSFCSPQQVYNPTLDDGTLADSTGSVFSISRARVLTGSKGAPPIRNNWAKTKAEVTRGRNQASLYP